MIKVHLNDTTEEENVKLFMEGIDIVLNQFDERLGFHEVAHAMASISLNMLRHIVDHSLPGQSNEKVNAELRNHLNRLLTAMEDEVWNQEQQ